MAVIEEVNEQTEKTIQDEISRKQAAVSAKAEAPPSSAVVESPMVTVDTQMIHDSIKVSNPKYKLQWKQTEKLVIMEVYVGGLSYNEVKVSYDDTSFSLNIKDPKYTLELKLANPVVKNFCVYKCQPEYFEVKLKKDLTRTSKKNMTWSSLYKGGSPVDKTVEVANAESNLSKDELQTTSETTPLVSTEMPTPKITHDWYQTDQYIIVEIRVKGLQQDQVKIQFETTSLSVSAKFPKSSAAKGSEYSLELDLANEVLPQDSFFKVLSTKLEIKMKKKEGIRWSALEGDGSLDALNKVVSNVTKEVEEKPITIKKKGPKDWSKVNKFCDTELEYLKDNQDAGDVFSMLYGDADEATKRAMNKSMQESGGTVLSTDWSDIGSRKVDRYKDKDEE